MQLLFATNNQNKLKEVRSWLADSSFNILGLKDLDINCEIPETEPTIEGNAKQKATFIKNRFNIDCFADDTGLIVKALDGAPGVYSARYAGPNANSQDNMAKLLKQLNGSNEREACFKTCIALIIDKDLYIFTGTCEGKITTSPKGTGGFGYDPIFIPDGYTKTFAEMTLEEKNKISHRSKAMSNFIDFLKTLDD